MSGKCSALKTDVLIKHTTKLSSISQSSTKIISSMFKLSEHKSLAQKNNKK